MRRIACLLWTVTLVAFLLPGAAFAQLPDDCQRLKFTAPEESTDVDPAEYAEFAGIFGLDGFEWCWSQQVKGKLNGTMVFCGHSSLYENDPLGLGIGPEIWGNPGFIHTKKGDVYTMGYGMSVWGAEGLDAFGGVTRIIGGTGIYKDAYGWTTERPMTIPPTYWIRSEGMICVPDGFKKGKKNK